MFEMKCVSSARNTEAVMMLSEILSPQKERDTQMLSAVHSEPGTNKNHESYQLPKFASW
jgi:hypothetical protein